MPETKRKLKVFLCHASEDKPVVREIYQLLRIEGWIDPWLDEKKLLPGQDWDLEIEKAVEETDLVIVFLSSNSVNKDGYVQKEIKKVLDVSDEKPDGAIFLIPLRLGDDVNPPRRLVKWQYVDYFPKDIQEDSYRRILRSLALQADKLNVLIEGSLSDIQFSASGNRLKLLIVDDHRVVVDGLKLALKRIAHFQIVGVAYSAQEAITKTANLNPNVVLMDIRLPGVSGIEACGTIVKHFPETKVLMLTSYAEDKMLFSAIQAGASGYVLKQIETEELVKAIDIVGKGGRLLDSVEERISRDHEDETGFLAFSDLNQSEKRVLMLISEGKTNREIAAELSLADGTVRNYAMRIVSKLGVTNRSEAALYALKHNLKDDVSM